MRRPNPEDTARQRGRRAVAVQSNEGPRVTSRKEHSAGAASLAGPCNLA